MTRKRIPRVICLWLAIVSAAGAVTADAALTAPANVGAAGFDESRIEVSWTDNSSNETGFEVHRSTDGPNGPFTAVSETAAQAVNHIDGGLNPSTQYCYKIRAVRVVRRKATYSEFSAVACATTLPAPFPVAPSNLRANVVSDVAISIAWQDNSGNENGFEIYRSSTGADGAFTWLARANSGTTGQVDGGLSPSTEYCYKVRAFANVAGTSYSDFSNTGCATTLAPPAGSELQVNSSTTGVDLDSDGYSLTVWRVSSDRWSYTGVAFTTLPVTGAVTLSGLNPADYLLIVSEMAVNCDSVGANPREVTVGGGPVSVQFDVSCAPVTQLAFADTSDGNDEIYVVNSNGTGTKQLTAHPAADVEPAWSPDGSRVAFRSNRDGPDEIYVMNADGSSVERLTDAAGGNFDPVWSPDGTKVAFTSYRDGNGEIYVMNADGSGLVNITNHPADDQHATWSPDGIRVAFSSTRDNPFGYPGIYVTDVAGSTVVSLSTDPYAPETEPAWSPDGTWLAVSHWGVSQTIWLISLTDGWVGGSLTAPSDLDCEIHSDPVWSPDSLKVAFTVTNYCPGESAVHAVRLNAADGPGNGTRITTGSSPSWRP